jgi:hypothetical protein
MDRYGDPEFLYHAAGARLWGLMAMRLANADILPLRYSTYARDTFCRFRSESQTLLIGPGRSELQTLGMLSGFVTPLPALRITDKCKGNSATEESISKHLTASS